jgi:hypothetical protein
LAPVANGGPLFAKRLTRGFRACGIALDLRFAVGFAYKKVQSSRRASLMKITSGSPYYYSTTVTLDCKEITDFLWARESRKLLRGTVKITSQ